MRIALVHSFYDTRLPSGENLAVQLQADALAEAGHTVRIVRQDTDRRRHEPLYKVRASIDVATGRGPDPTAELAAFDPDVVHVHNLFPNFGTAWLDAWPGPLVATMHNFRPMCAASTLHRDGQACTLCPDGDPWAAVRHRCYRDSVVATLPLAWRNRNGATGDALVRRADAMIVISERAKHTYEASGVDGDRVEVVPNFVSTDGPAELAAGDRWLFAGRLAAEKGLVELLAAWPREVGLDIYGDGELRAQVEEAAGPSVRVLGHVSNEVLRARMPGYRGLVFPSRWFEAGPPLIYLEALAAGVPALAIEGNGAADDVAAHRTGEVYGLTAGEDDLRRAIDRVAEAGTALRERCRHSFATRFSRDTWLANVSRLYERVTSTATAPR